MTLTPSVVDTIPIWTSDDPSNWNAAFTYHKPWAKPGPDGYLTVLTAADEFDFQEWVATYNVAVDVASLLSNYDYRGYWHGTIRGTSKGYIPGSRLPDTWLTPYSTMFSAKSIYSKPNCPYHWYGNQLIDDSTNRLLFWAEYVPPKNAAVDYIEKSSVDPSAIGKGLMGDDLDMEAVRLYISGKLKLKVDDQILEAETNRTIEGASTLTLTLLDDDRKILRSGLLSSKLDMEIDGLWWRLVQVGKVGDNLDLVFETREIAILRMYNEIIGPQLRTDKLTRSRFILRLIREVKGIHIPVIMPGINEVNPALGMPDPGPGIPDNLPANNDPLDIIFDPRRGLTVKGDRATKEQINNVNIVLGVGVNMKANRKVLVCSIMTGIMESQCLNLGGVIDRQGHLIKAGFFQQNDRWWPASGNVATDAQAFFRSAIENDRRFPNLSYNDLCQIVQSSDAPDAYGQYKGEAENWVTAYLNEPPDEKSNIEDRNTSGAGSSLDNQSGGGTRTPTGGTANEGTNDNTYSFYRGIPGQRSQDWEKEDSWTCIQRLADDVDWRAFFVGGTFWFVDDDFLFKQEPIMTITESSIGIDSIDFDYDSNKKWGNVTLKARIGRWTAPPGAVVVLQNLGPVNGRWLVNEFTRSLFDLTATIVLKKPLPDLKESSVTNNVQGPAVSDPLPPAPGPGKPPDNTTPCGTLLLQVQTLIKAGKLNFDWTNDEQGLLSPTGAVRRKDGQLVVISCDVLRSFIYMCQEFPGIWISSMIGSHDQYVAGSNNQRQSRHWTGDAFDVGGIAKDHDVNTNSAAEHNLVKDFMLYMIESLGTNIGPNQLLNQGIGGAYYEDLDDLSVDGGVVSPKFTSKRVGGHMDHVHVGY